MKASQALRLRVLALIGIMASVLCSWIMLTPLGFGMTWDDIAPGWGEKLFFVAPAVALTGATLARITRRASPTPEVILLSAPVYQALFLAVSVIASRSDAY